MTSVYYAYVEYKKHPNKWVSVGIWDNPQTIYDTLKDGAYKNSKIRTISKILIDEHDQWEHPSIIINTQIINI